MLRKNALVIEGDSAGLSAYVPELPAILVTGHSVEELSSRAAEAIRRAYAIHRETNPSAIFRCPRPRASISHTDG